ncbi:MAG: NUDIX hydrolase [Planctomycetota bacterium]|nr:NUDIX hydrolase [Planctomycetota bacterium]
MHRRALIALLQRYGERSDSAAAMASRFAAFVQEHEDCLLRTCVPGHITASAWILSSDYKSCLLTHHRKLDRWLQLGGHVDGEEQVHMAALREAREESGMAGFEFLLPSADLEPLDLDVHTIPANDKEPEHLHWDVRFLLRALPEQQLEVSEESHALRWVPRDEVSQLTEEFSVLRLDEKASSWLAEGPVALAT